MRDLRQALCWTGVLLATIVVSTGCTYAALQKLSLDEQTEFHFVFGPVC